MVQHERLDQRRQGNKSERLKPTGKWSEFSQAALERMDEITPETTDDTAWRGMRYNELKIDGAIGRKRFRFYRENGQQVIEERLTAHAQTADQLTTADRQQQWDVKKEAVVIVIFPDGKQLSLNALLPPGYTLRPFMNEVVPISLELLAHVSTLRPLETMENYQGATCERTGGQMRGDTKEVVYENLSKPGSMWVLFHEIGHAWDTHHGNMLPSVDGVVHDLIQLSQSLPPPGDATEVIYLKSQPWKNDSMPVDLALFKNRIKEAIDSERGPTAFALRLMRQLRNQGFDLEPDANLDDFKPAIDAALQSYQRSLERYYATEADRQKMQNTTFV